MKKIIIYGATGAGKTYYASSLADFYGVKHIIDDERYINNVNVDNLVQDGGVLILTAKFVDDAIDIKDALRDAGLVRNKE